MLLLRPVSGERRAAVKAARRYAPAASKCRVRWFKQGPVGFVERRGDDDRGTILAGWDERLSHATPSARAPVGGARAGIDRA